MSTPHVAARQADKSKPWQRRGVRRFLGTCGRKDMPQRVPIPWGLAAPGSRILGQDRATLGTGLANCRVMWDTTARLMKTLRRTLGLLAWAWIAVALGAPGLSGVVLCMGSDGYLALEPAHGGGCRSHGETGPAPRHTESATGSCAEDDCCADCVDVPLASDGVLHLVKRRGHDRLPRHSPSGAAPGIHAGMLGADPSAVRTTRPRRAPPGASASLDAQRSIVLRT